MRDGQWTWNYENGTKRLIENYKNGTIINITGYSKTGKKEREMKLDNGNGTFTQYYDNGKVKQDCNQQSDGSWVCKNYDKDGKFLDESRFNFFFGIFFRVASYPVKFN